MRRRSSGSSRTWSTFFEHETPALNAATLEKIVNELLDVRGNRSFRDAIEALARELTRR
jgi:hypothetical protein